MSTGIDSSNIAAVSSIVTIQVGESESGDHAIEDLRLPKGSVADNLFRRPWKFDFFQTVTLLQGFAEQKQQDDEPFCRIAQFTLPSEECVRFTVPHTTAFPTAAVPQIRWDDHQNRASVEVNFIGLTGPSGVLPEPYNDRLRDISRSAKHAERGALRDWLDNFNHRLISLFYGAWAKYRFSAKTRSGLIRKSPANQEPAGIHVALAAIAGLDRSVIDDRTDSDQTPKIDRDEWLGLAGLLAQRPMNVSNLTSALERCLGVDINIVQFQGCWLDVDQETQSRLGIENDQLGVNAILGERIWTRQQRILIEVGPLGRADFNRFLPPSQTNPADGYLRLRELVEVFVGSALQFDIRPILKIQQPVEIELSVQDVASRLGIDSWLGTPLGREVAGDAVFAGG
ncbi:MAG TPA: type VI secretion system baseplate subunit TssG [Planctomycetaceae bacterium]|nr:type VI secretion system baseplate subunit TssG [Planctomycetaceae bacterium]